MPSQHNNHHDVQFVMSKGPDAFCANHLNKVAEFTINIDSEEMVYCSGCASKLASQGFSVMRLQQSGSSSKIPSAEESQIPSAKPIPSYPEHHGNPLYEEIIHLLKDLVEV